MIMLNNRIMFNFYPGLPHMHVNKTYPVIGEKSEPILASSSA